MGIVYDAEDERLPRRVALKFLSDELVGNPDAIRRFRREAHTLARLNHPNICTIYEIEDQDGKPFIAMERLEGTNLKSHIARKTLETREILEIAAQICQALEAAHGAGIVHRDIKPGNIFVAPTGQVKVLDFGMARSFNRDDSTSKDGSTIPGRPIGTVNYMAPERILQMPLDARCDLFSLGVVIYEMATGRLPFAGASPSETVTNILENQPTPLTKLSLERPVQLEQIVERLTAKRAEDRYETAHLLLADLSGLSEKLRDGRRGLFGRLFRER
jgi:serine/threonine protein kinase